MSSRVPDICKYSGLPPSLECQCHLVPPRSSCCINFFFPFFLPLFFCFQLSNGFSHYSLSTESHVGPVGASLFPHCLPASRLLPRVTSVHLPDYAHYYTIGPGMFPSSQIPSWKVCVSPPSPPSLIASVLAPLLPPRFSPRFSPQPLPLTLCLLPHNTSSLSKFSRGGPETSRQR